MPVITAIEQQKKREDRFNIFVNGVFAFAASATTVFRYGLRTNQEITQEKIDELVKENEYGLLLDKTLRWLGVRPRSEKELLDYLHKFNPKAVKPPSERAIELVILRIKELGYVNDEEFARWFVQSRTRSRPRGKRLLYLELMQKGIDKELAKQITEEDAINVDDPESQQMSEYDLAMKAAQKKLVSYQKLLDKEFRQKMGAYLARKGFDWDTIKAVINQLHERD